MARLTTHVLDTARGTPAAGVTVHLHAVSKERRQIHTYVTNRDGRTDDPLISGGQIETGVYELTFDIGDYFRHVGVPVTDPPFLDVVVIRFGIADPFTAIDAVHICDSPVRLSIQTGWKRPSAAAARPAV